MLIFEEDFNLGFWAVGDEVRVRHGDGSGNITTTLVKITQEAVDCECDRGLLACPKTEKRIV